MAARSITGVGPWRLAAAIYTLITGVGPWPLVVCMQFQNGAMFSIAVSAYVRVILPCRHARIVCVCVRHTQALATCLPPELSGTSAAPRIIAMGPSSVEGPAFGSFRRPVCGLESLRFLSLLSLPNLPSSFGSYGLGLLILRALQTVSLKRCRASSQTSLVRRLATASLA